MYTRVSYCPSSSQQQHLIHPTVPICENFAWIKILNKRGSALRGEIIYIKGKIDWIKVYCVYCVRWNRKSLNYQQIEYYFRKIYEYTWNGKKYYIYTCVCGIGSSALWRKSFILIFFCDRTTSLRNIWPL